MPRIVQGLEKVVRTHHISSPTDETMLRMAGPNACNICHLDRSIQWTKTELNKGWAANIEPGGRWSSEYGEQLARPVGDAWLNHSQPVVRLIASDAFSRSSRKLSEMPELFQTLKDAHAVNRMFGLFAVERVLGRELSENEYAPLAAKHERDKMVDLLLERFAKENE
jgi:hypothetical protein